MILVYTYLLILLHLCVHELGHAAAAHLIGVKILRVKIGGGEPVLSIGRYELALWITGGSTEVAADDLAEKSILQRLFFFAGGTAAELVLWLMLSAVLNGLYDVISSACFFVLIFTNNCPFLPGSDLRGFLHSVSSECRTDPAETERHGKAKRISNDRR